MEENRVERRLKTQIEKIGGRALKFISPGVTGVPDRIVLLPGGRIIFVELKAPGKKLRKIQEYRAKELRALGFEVKCLDTVEKIDLFIKDVMQNLQIL